MRIGLMADTHDSLPAIARAVDRLNREKVELVLHAGDFVSPFVIPELSALDADLIGVYGNNDGDRGMLLKKCEESRGVEIRGFFAEVEAGESSVALLHGHEPELLHALIESEAFDAVVYGHTHRAVVSREGSTLVINPGEVCGYLSGRSTVAVLDTGERNAVIIPL